MTQCNIYFYVSVTVVGCPVIKPPVGAIVIKEDDTATIQCNNTGERWYLTCDGEQWVGTIGNCTGHNLHQAYLD